MVKFYGRSRVLIGTPAREELPAASGYAVPKDQARDPSKVLSVVGDKRQTIEAGGGGYDAIGQADALACRA